MPALWLGLRRHPTYFALGIDQDGTWQVSNIRCPICDRLIVSVRSETGARTTPLSRPAPLRAKLSEDVPADLAADYWTAGQILPFSEEASAAISRRLLQRVLSSKAGAGYGGLADQVKRAVASPTMPRVSQRGPRHLRQTGRDWKSHEVKSYRCETLAPVNEGEARWLLEVLKPLFEFYYVQPALVALMRQPIEERLAPAPLADADELEEAEGQAEDWTVVMDEPAG